MYDKNALQLYIERTYLPDAFSLPDAFAASASKPDAVYGFCVKQEEPLHAAGVKPDAAPRKERADRLLSRLFQLPGAKESDSAGAPLPAEAFPNGQTPAFALDESFRDALLRLIDERGYTEPEVYKRAGIDRRHFGKIKNDFENRYRPSKKTAVQLALGLGLSLDETNEFIGRAGYSLSRSILSDVIVMYFLENGVTDLATINEALFDADQQTLSD